jgi:hypothetical protein
MLRALCLAMTILVLPLESASADAAPDPGENAALKYWQAFATLPKFTDAEGQKLNAECLTMPLDAHAREVVTRAEYALQMMHHGAALPRCDWGLGYEEGIYTRLPQGPAARELSALACLRARLRFEEGRNAEAVEDVVDGMTLGRQVSFDGTLIMVLVGYRVESRMGEALALYLPKLEPGAIKALKTRLDALPPGSTPAAVMKFEEKSLLDWLIRKVKETKDRESLLALLTPLVGEASEPEGKGGDPARKGRAFVEECGDTADGVVKRAEEMRPSFALMAKELDLPLDQFEKEFAREKMKQDGNPVFRVFFSALDNVRRAQARTDVRRALLSAALAVQLDGRDALKNHPDPVVGGPFEYVAFDGGFELRSKWKSGDKPLALTVGLRGR